MTEYENWSKQQLIDKIRELESLNNTKPEDSISTPDQTLIQPTENTTTKVSDKKKKKFVFSNHPTRFIALKFAYLGWNYNGLAFQYEPTPLPTVEEEILKALEKARLISEADPSCCKFSRCGRTDKGVSAMNQVISLNVRSNLSLEEQQDKVNDNKELPYITILNSLLPSDIRITALSLRPPVDFDARFSCKYRHYRYLINKEGLDIDLMNEAAAKYVGIHDFRNFCKLDGSKQITNYNREVYSSKIIEHDDDFYIFDLKGSAFLWHQVRCMVAILFTVGQKLEAPTLVDDLLNVEKYPTKPNYEMANDIPLILYDCVFPEMEWYKPSELPNFNKAFKEFNKFKGSNMDYNLKTRVSNIMKDMVIQDEEKSPVEGKFVNLGDGKGRNFRNYVPILKRDFGESFEVVNERHRIKKLSKTQST
ncbi:tRNA pseudouridine(38/39) synthase [[Candida] jaroonii]|uniref:tRNA pseudouridine(38/39) synthase n=1 Tax=[Candida] jaroonii TaxID=467808 RepID=A0ACA9Y0E2_9ASCO|nr:tRNA pseudouridine(38/39) synthase [[Candida] jaroonii]